MFEVILTKDGQLLLEAQKLRKIVFFGRGGRDKDRFDKICQHLVVLDSAHQKVIGTYRLLLGSVAKKTLGFYSEQEFDLTNIRRNCQGEILELGRACVDPAYRKNQIINLLWQAIIKYIEDYKVRYVFGCASIDEPSPEKIGRICSFFKKNYFSPLKFRVAPLKEKEYPYLKINHPVDFKETYKLLPSLLRGYLKMGAYVCSDPVWDKEFNTADFFMLLDVKRINLEFRKRFDEKNY